MAGAGDSHAAVGSGVQPTRRKTAAHDTNAETLAGLWKTAGLEEERRGLFLMDAERRRLEAENQYRHAAGAGRLCRAARVAPAASAMPCSRHVQHDGRATEYFARRNYFRQADDGRRSSVGFPEANSRTAALSRRSYGLRNPSGIQTIHRINVSFIGQYMRRWR